MLLKEANLTLQKAVEMCVINEQSDQHTEREIKEGDSQ